MCKSLLAFLVLLVCLTPVQAAAFCGFYVAGGDAEMFNDATQVVLVRDGTRTVLSMQNSYQGPVGDFAMVVPVPQVLNKQDVKTLEKDVFDRLDKMTAPRLVEYFEEDPCKGRGFPLSFFRQFVSPRPMYKTMEVQSASLEFEHGVEVESKFAVGEYDIVVLSANNATGLDSYLREKGYKIPAGAEPYLRPYVADGSYFFVAKVDPTRAKFDGDRAVLSPLRFEYTSDKFALPVRLGMINSSGEQDLIVYTIAPNQRFDVANYPNAFIPTNIQVEGAIKDSFGEFYQALFDATLKKNPKAVVTEYSWQFNGCDPCPDTPLGATEMNALGMLADESDDKGAMMAVGQWTITRMHARYAPDDVGEDLVFRAASPVVGGREHADNEDPEVLERTHLQEAVNSQFQGRYIIRNRWLGALTCFNPTFGQWGSDGGGIGNKFMSTATSPNTAGSEPIAGTGELGKWLAQGVAELGVAGDQPMPLSPDWFAIVAGYTITLILMALLLFALRLLRNWSFRAFIAVNLLIPSCTCCVADWIGQITLALYVVGVLALTVEHFVRRRSEKDRPDQVPG